MKQSLEVEPYRPLLRAVHSKMHCKHIVEEGARNEYCEHIVNIQLQV